MSRKIKFRAMPTHDIDFGDFLKIKEDEFVYGNLIWDDKQPYIVGDIVDVTKDNIILEQWIPVKKFTIGQSTGLKDGNGREIWEGDIIKGCSSYWHDSFYYKSGVAVVKFVNGGFSPFSTGDDYSEEPEDVEVIASMSDKNIFIIKQEGLNE